MAKALDFNKIRRRRRMVETIKRLVVVALIVGLVTGVVYLNDLFVNQGLSIRVGDLVESYGGAGYPVELPGGVIRDMKDMGGSLALLNDTNLIIYNKKGKVTANIQQMTDKTVLDVNSDRALTFDVGGREYGLHSHSRTTSGAVEYGILAADLGSGGEFALVTSSRQFVAEVTVYSEPGENHIFRWSSPENHITGVSLAPKGSMMAVSSVTTENGEIKSIINLFHLQVDEKVGQVELEDVLILDIDFYEADRIGVLTDREYTVLDAGGAKLGTYSLGDTRVAGIQRYNRDILLLTEYREARRSEIILLGEDCVEKARLEGANNIRDMAIGKRWIYVLDDSGIARYHHDFTLVDKLELRGITRMQLAGERLYYCTSEEIRVIN